MQHYFDTCVQECTWVIVSHLTVLMLCREDETPAAWQLADSLYWQAFRKATAPLQHAHDHEKLISKIADLYAAIPHHDAAPAAATLDSVHCIALTHACICMLAASLACPEKRQPQVIMLKRQQLHFRLYSELLVTMSTCC